MEWEGTHVEDDGVEERGEVEGEEAVEAVLVLAQEERLLVGVGVGARHGRVRWFVRIDAWVEGTHTHVWIRFGHRRRRRRQRCHTIKTNSTCSTCLHGREGQDAAEDRVEDGGRGGDEERARDGEDGLLLRALALLQPDDADEEADGGLVAGNGGGEEMIGGVSSAVVLNISSSPRSQSHNKKASLALSTSPPMNLSWSFSPSMKARWKRTSIWYHRGTE